MRRCRGFLVGGNFHPPYATYPINSDLFKLAVINLINYKTFIESVVVSSIQIFC